MKSNIFLCVTILSVFSYLGYSQKSASADKNYDKYGYIKAASSFERLVEKGNKSEDLLQKLGNSYYFNGELEKAFKWYDQLFVINANQQPEYIYRYAQSLKAVGQITKANQMLDLFNTKATQDSRGGLYQNNKNYLEQIKSNSGRYKIEDAGVNSKFSDYGSAMYGSKLVFSSSRDTGSLGHRKHSWTNQNFTNLYSAEQSGDNASKVVKFSTKINSKFNESTPVFSKDGKTMYFTRNNYLSGKKGKDNNKVTLLKIYKAILKDDNWSDVKELPFNSDQYSVAHPSLSADEKTLYFASDMPGGMGQSDLYKVSITGQDSYGTPENLGKGINTEGRETFPYLSDDNELYFCSDGHLGLGGLDVFVSTIKSDGSLGDVQNVGDGVNSPKDDFGYLIDSKTRKGFFTSNREGGQGYDDIYKFVETRKLKCLQSLAGIVSDSKTSEPLSGAKVSLYDSSAKLVSSTQSDASGRYSFEVECGKRYAVKVEKTGYTATEQNTSIPELSGTTNLDLNITPIPAAKSRTSKPVAVGDDLAKTFDIKMIYFDLGKYDIKPKAEVELKKILEAMLENPKIKIDVRSHTDCRASAKYNMTLSDNRVKSTIAWLIRKGISSTRLTGRGYGESQLVNDCACEPTSKSNCSEEQHQMNRRSEFIVVSL